MSTLLALALMIAPQAAPSAADLADAKCVAAMSLLDDQAEAKDKSGMQAAMMFFIGKIVGRSGNGAVGPALTATLEGVTAGDTAAVAAIAEQCGGQVEQATEKM